MNAMEHTQMPFDMSVCERIRTLLPAYIDGKATKAQADEIAAHLAACPACRERYSLLCRLPEALDAALPTPPPAMHERIMQSVRVTPQHTPKTHYRHATLLASMLCFLLLCTALVLGTFDIYTALDSPIQDGATDQAPDSDSDDAPDDGESMEDTLTPQEKPPARPEGNEPADPVEPPDDDLPDADTPPGSDNEDTSDSEPPESDDETQSSPPDHDADRPSPEPPDIDEDTAPAPDSPPADGNSSSAAPLSLPMNVPLIFVQQSTRYWICPEYGYILITPDKDGDIVLVDLSNRFAVGTRLNPSLTPQIIEIAGAKSYLATLLPKGEGRMELQVYAIQ